MSLALTWVHREPPLARAGVTAHGAAARSLAVAAAALVDAGVPLRAAGRHAGGDDCRLLVLGEPDDLPWCADARYVGWESGVLVPTGSRPRTPADLVAASARAALPDAALVIVLPDALVGVPAPRRGVDGPTLREWARTPG